MVHPSGVSDPAVRCPVHGTPAAYWHAGDDWACTIPGCGYGYGIATATSTAAAILTALRSRTARPRGGRPRGWLRRRRSRPRY